MDAGSPSRPSEGPVAIALPTGAERGSPHASLEGRFTPGLSGVAVVAPPHPLYGGQMDSPVVEALVRGLIGADIGALRFNWRGVGASDGQASGEPGVADADYAAAMAFVSDGVEAPLYACGYSFGAATALRAATRDPAVRCAVVVAPPAAMIDAESFRRFEGAVFMAVGERDELVDPERLETLAGECAGSHFCRLAGADHFFAAGGLEALGHELQAWLEGLVSDGAGLGP